MLIPSQDQVMAQLRIVIPALGTIASAFGISKATDSHYVDLALSLVGPVSYLIVAVWSLIANSRSSIMAAAAKPASPDLPAPLIVLPKEEADLAQRLPVNVTTTETHQVVNVNTQGALK
jgi:hypothetical protein